MSSRPRHVRIDNMHEPQYAAIDELQSSEEKSSYLLMKLAETEDELM